MSDSACVPRDLDPRLLLPGGGCTGAFSSGLQGCLGLPLTTSRSPSMAAWTGTPGGRLHAWSPAAGRLVDSHSHIEPYPRLRPARPCRRRPAAPWPAAGAARMRQILALGLALAAGGAPARAACCGRRLSTPRGPLPGGAWRGSCRARRGRRLSTPRGPLASPAGAHPRDGCRIHPPARRRRGRRPRGEDLASRPRQALPQPGSPKLGPARPAAAAQA